MTSNSTQKQHNSTHIHILNFFKIDIQRINKNPSLKDSDKVLLSHALSQAEFWNPTPAFLAKDLGWTERQAYRSLSRLRKAGYYVSVENRNDNNTFATRDHHFYSVPVDEFHLTNSSGGEKQQESPELGGTPPETPPVKNDTWKESPESPNISPESPEKSTCQDCQTNIVNNTVSNNLVKRERQPQQDPQQKDPTRGKNSVVVDEDVVVSLSQFLKKCEDHYDGSESNITRNNLIEWMSKGVTTYEDTQFIPDEKSLKIAIELTFMKDMIGNPGIGNYAGYVTGILKKAPTVEDLERDTELEQENVNDYYDMQDAGTTEEATIDVNDDGQVFAALLNRLSQRISPNAFRTWIEPLSWKRSARTLTIGCDDDTFMFWVQHNIIGIIEEELQAITGTGYDIRFSVLDEMTEPPSFEEQLADKVQDAFEKYESQGMSEQRLYDAKLNYLKQIGAWYREERMTDDVTPLRNILLERNLLLESTK